MTDWQAACLTAMAIALVVMAIMQVAFVIVIARLAMKATTAVQEIRRDLMPLVAKFQTIADDAARATALLAMQVERVDHMLATTSERIEQTVGFLQDVVLAPLRKGSAILAAIRAGFALFRGFQSRPASERQTREDEDALFVG